MAQLAARRSHNPKVASSILAGSILDFLNNFIFVLVVLGEKKKDDFLIGEGFEPSPPKRLVP